MHVIYWKKALQQPKHALDLRIRLRNGQMGNTQDACNELGYFKQDLCNTLRCFIKYVIPVRHIIIKGTVINYVVFYQQDSGYNSNNSTLIYDICQHIT
jgi:hypothetical protein